MMKNRHSSLCASAAIAAALALGSTPAFAQFADATVTPFPVIAEPAPPPPVMTSSPIVQAVPDPAPVVEADEAAASPPAARTTRAAAPRTTSAAVSPVPVADTAPAETAAPVAVTPVEPIVAPPPVAAAPIEPATSSDTNTNGVLVPTILGGLAVLLLAIWGFVAIGRRRLPVQRTAPRGERPLVERPVVARAEPEPLLAATPAFVPATPTPISARIEPPAPILAHSGASVALPRTVPTTFAERNALIDRMIAAKPDRANPFTSPIQRRKRAKLILQSLGRDFGEVEPWIDFSQYTGNWPELTRRYNAAA